MVDGPAPDSPRPGRPGARSHNLPVELTSFIGREREIAEVVHLLGRTRLLTLTGAGGAGKTRLALRVAAGHADVYPDGVWLVELATLSDPSHVAHTVAVVLGVRDVPGRDLLALLLDELRSRSLLLVLDNCEHLVEACAHLVETLLRGCPGLRILATSREPLRADGETTWRVPSLSVPAAHRVTSGAIESPAGEDPRASEAVRLFLDRAQAALPSFCASDRELELVAEVCRRLDGIPLAIELAAARVRALAVAQIAARLDDRFRLLIGGNHTALRRHQTLRATVDWSHDLLSEPERAVLRRLAAFAGGWTLEAAEAVCSCASLEPSEVLNVLAQLVDKSMVVLDVADGQARYRLLETIREYATEKLREADEETVARSHHATWCLGLAERAEPELKGPDQAAWLARLEVEHDNLRAALGWCVECGDVDVGLRLGAALQEFWSWRNHHADERKWFAVLLALPGASAATKARAKVLNGLAHLAHQQGDYATARAVHEQSLAIARALNDLECIARSLSDLGVDARCSGDYAAARKLFEESLAVGREAGYRWIIAMSLNNLGFASHQQGDHAAARLLFEESLAWWRDVGDREGMARSLAGLGYVARGERAYPLAHSLFGEGLAIFQALADRWGIAQCLEGFADLAVAQGQPERALRLAGAAATLRDLVGSFCSPAKRTFERALTAARQMLSEEASLTAWSEGRAMGLNHAIAYGLAGEPGRHPIERPKLVSAARELEVLTPREREVGGLVAHGLTNRQIGNALMITEGTAGLHVKHILGKLGFSSRAQIAAWAVEHGLTAPAQSASAGR